VVSNPEVVQTKDIVMSTPEVKKDIVVGLSHELI